MPAIADPLRYRGRFAPSPTGPLHFGSLVAAVGSYLDARSRGGEWLLRIEDLDLPRCPAANAEAILRELDAFGFEWDGEVVWQSRRTTHYTAALDSLRRAGALYPCACSRREIADSQLAPDGAPIYPGTCRNGLPPGRQARSWRLRVDDGDVRFDDRIQGPCRQDVGREVGDFVLLRADGPYAYQLAVVVDDADQGVSDVVRGADLLDSTPRQIVLQRRLGLAQPRYAHLPIAVNAAGEKLSKQTGAAALDATRAAAQLTQALRFLGQMPPAELGRAPLGEVWDWARRSWSFDAIPRRRTIVELPFEGQNS
jgi:glutamyl-Q tRNA(Asp) synthetase